MGLNLSKFNFWLMLKQVAVLILLVMMSGFAYSASVGTAPGFMDFGEIEQGETYEHTVYITSNFDSNFTVNPSFTNPRQSMVFNDARDERYDTSEYGIDGWVYLEDNVLVEPEITNTRELMDGRFVNANGEFTLTVEIPYDAEPGYHYGRIRLNPEISTDDGGPGSLNLGETAPSFRFRVPGDAERQVTVQDVRGFRTDDDQASVEVLLRNTGTVTTSAQNFEADILNSRGESVETLTISGVKLAPGESEWTNARWTGENVDEGNYQLDGEVDYLTGQAYASGSFSLSDIVQVIPEDSPEVEGEEEQETVPLWLIFMVLALMAVLMWSFDIEPFWILAIVGFLAVAAFILMSGVSNILLVVLLMVMGIVVYGVM